MEPRTKQSWSDEETQCFLALWSSNEVQQKLEGASRTKPVFEFLRRKMAAAGYERSVDQLINKLKKLKQSFRHSKRAGGGNGAPKRSKHIDILDFVIGNGPDQSTAAAAAAAAALNSTAPTSLLLAIVNEPAAAERSAAEPPEPANGIKVEARLTGGGPSSPSAPTPAEESEPPLNEGPPAADGASSSESPFQDASHLIKYLVGSEGDEPQKPVACSSPLPDAPSCSSSSPSSPGSSRRSKVKRKRGAESEILEYLKWSERRMREDREREVRLTSVFLSSLQKMEENNKAVLALLGRMVSAMERAAPE